MPVYLYVPGTPGHRARQYAGYGGYQSLRALCLRCRAPPLLPGLRSVVFWKGVDFGIPSWPIPSQVAGSEAWVEPQASYRGIPKEFLLLPRQRSRREQCPEVRRRRSLLRAQVEAQVCGAERHGLSGVIHR